MAEPGDTERAELHERISATCARIDEFCDSADAFAMLARATPPPRLVREVVFGEEDFDKTFMPRFICRTCGPTNQVCADETGFICIICEQAAAYQVFDKVRYLPQS